jgi:hypothetical protein
MVNAYQEQADLLKEDFDNGILHLYNYEAVGKFKSVRRAIRRGHVSMMGDIYPKRPFKNCKAKRKSVTFMKRRLYEQSRHLNKCMN